LECGDSSPLFAATFFIVHMRFKAASAKILIAGDNQQSVELLRTHLERSDITCDIQTSTDGAQTLRAVRRDNPDLILLDAMTPKISGIDLCQKLKGDEATRNIQILIITALDQTDHIARDVEAGTDDIVIKPVNKLELILRIQSLLRNRRLRDEL